MYRTRPKIEDSKPGLWARLMCVMGFHPRCYVVGPYTIGCRVCGTEWYEH